MKILVCGGRDYHDHQALFAALDTVSGFCEVTMVVHGAAKGADTLAGLWASHRHVPVKAYPADWDAYQRRAGPIRNQQMLDLERPDLVVAFPGGAGTRDMVRRSKEQGFKVLDLRMRLTT